MKNTKKMLAVGTMIFALTATSLTAFAAATYKTPAEAAAGVTGQTLEAVTNERAQGKTYGAIANEAGKLEEFKAEVLATKKDILDQRVAAGTMTQAQADLWLQQYETQMAACDGTTQGGLGRGSGLGCGASAGAGCGVGGMGTGARTSGRGMGRGMGSGFNAPATSIN